jgi:hypothetical protein
VLASTFEEEMTTQELKTLMRRAMDSRMIENVKAVLASGYKPSQILYDDTRETALHHAARYFDAEMCQVFVDAGASIDAKDKYKATPLETAIEEGRPAEVVKVLVAAGPDLARRNKEGWTVLHCAGAQDNSSDKKIFSADVCQILLDGGADLFAIEGYGITVLHLAAHVDAWRFFTQAGISPDFVPEGVAASYLTPFQDAVRDGESDIVAYCVAQGAVDLDQRTLDGRTLMELSSDTGVRAALRSGRMSEEISVAVDAGGTVAEAVAGERAPRGRQLSI